MFVWCKRRRKKTPLEIEFEKINGAEKRQVKSNSFYCWPVDGWWCAVKWTFVVRNDKENRKHWATICFTGLRFIMFIIRYMVMQHMHYPYAHRRTNQHTNAEYSKQAKHERQAITIEWGTHSHIIIGINRLSKTINARYLPSLRPLCIGIFGCFVCASSE